MVSEALAHSSDYTSGINEVSEDKLPAVVDISDDIIEDIKCLFSDHAYSQPVVDRPSASIVVPETNPRDKVLIVDGIDKQKFKVSSDILKEVAIYAPGIKVTQAYTLAKGGIAIHVQSPEDRSQLFDSLPKNPFGGGHKKKLASLRSCPVYIKRVPFSLECNSIAKALSFYNVPVSYLSRVINCRTGRPSLSLKLYTSPEAANWLLSEGIVINGSKFVVERKKAVQSQVIRCFNCQRFGHIARFCKAEPACSNCATNHLYQGSCNFEPKCVNCSGSHASSDPDCPSFISHDEYLSTQYSIAQHVSCPSESSSREI